jgi:Outer membrane protein beta-barrel domain
MTVRTCVLVRDCGSIPSALLRRCESLRVLRIPLLVLLAVSLSAVAQVGTPNPPQVPDAGSLAVGGLYMYPQHGQTQKQQAVDRYECYSWARSQTGYDPSAPTSGLSPSQQSSRLSDYRRAMSACLEARGYTVSAPPAASAAPPPAAAAVPPAVIASARRSAELNYHPFEFQIDGGYTVTAGMTNQDLDGGSNAGVGFIWFPTAALPLGLRVDGSYSTFNPTSRVLSSTNYSEGWEHIYGGDADVQLDLAHRSSRQKLYLLGGVGRYREQTRLKRIEWENGYICGWYWCVPGYFPAVTAELNTTSAWERSWNAGIGWEIALGPRTSFFIEGRYQRILPNNSHQEFVPIRVGLRF